MAENDFNCVVTTEIFHYKNTNKTSCDLFVCSALRSGHISLLTLSFEGLLTD